MGEEYQQNQLSEIGYCLSPDITVEHFCEDGLIFDGAHVYRLNETALLIMKLSDGQHTVSQIARHMVEHFDVSEEAALEDIKGLYTILSGREMVRLVK